MNLRAAIGLQRLIISEGPTFPALTNAPLFAHIGRHVSAVGAISRKPRHRPRTRGKMAVAVVDRLTSRGRLDRLVGIRRLIHRCPEKTSWTTSIAPRLKTPCGSSASYKPGKQPVSSI